MPLTSFVTLVNGNLNFIVHNGVQMINEHLIHTIMPSYNQIKFSKHLVVDSCSSELQSFPPDAKIDTDYHLQTNEQK